MQKLYNSLIILLIIILTMLLIKQLNLSKTHLLIENQPQEYMEDIKLFNYDQKGILKNIIISQNWKFSAKNNISILKKPKIIIYKWPEYLYKIAGNVGKILHENNLNTDIKLIKLYSDIHINQKYLNHNKHGFNLNTSYLEFNPNNEIASTEKPVTIYKPGLIINGIGMQADLKKHQLELRHNVRSRYIDQNHYINNKYYNINKELNYE